ncbi:MAG TPA: rRNA maturation RNase YbeY [Saprospiraceae bacterium]|nr:rRNA maturation RNase YbeY [Saprospiraceae bacterium]HNT19244.1 rRNA maturation RNase YbeY [Saprospiraceae bacterium]
MIRFHYRYPAMRVREAGRLKSWLAGVAKNEGKSVSSMDYIFVDDPVLLEINRQSLHHDYFTDIITFPYQSKPIIGEIYISVDRIREHAAEYGVSFSQELHRVMVHGLLHLCGYSDKSGKEKKRMTEKEDFYLDQV